MASEVPNDVGFGRSDAQSFTIPSGGTGANQERIDLGRPYGFLVITCEDCSDIASTTAMTLQVSPEEGIPMLDLYETNDPSTKWSKGDLPTSGTLFFYNSHALGMRFVRIVLDTVTDGDVTFKVWGYSAAVVNQPDL